MESLCSRALAFRRPFLAVEGAAAELAEGARRRRQDPRRLLAVGAEHALDLERPDVPLGDRRRRRDQGSLAGEERVVRQALRPRLPPREGKGRLVGAGRERRAAKGRAFLAEDRVERALVVSCRCKIAATVIAWSP